MLESLKCYAYDRRVGLLKVGGVVGAVYLVGRYVSERLEEVRDMVVQQRTARDM
jgi:peroxin-3